MRTVNFDHFPLESGDLVLDLGCGEGRHVISAYTEADVHSIGVDLSLEDLKTARERFSSFDEPDNTSKTFGLSSANALQLPFADNTFDKVICSEVLEHIPDYRGALSEIERVLKPGGLFCASVPRRWPEQICWALSKGYYNPPGGHLRIFRSTELRSEVEGLGFQHYARHWAHALHVPFWWLKCIFWSNRDGNWLVKQYAKHMSRDFAISQ